MKEIYRNCIDSIYEKKSVKRIIPCLHDVHFEIL